MRCPTLITRELPPPPQGKLGWPWTEGVYAPPPETVVDSRRALPVISIVIPSLNHGAFLEEAIRSVLQQDYPNLELIVVDGLSRDGSVDVIRKYDECLTNWLHEKDEGTADALNKGFRLASGQILGFLSADDLLLPGALHTIAREFHRRPGADVVSGHGYMSSSSGTERTPMFSDRWDLDELVHTSCVLVQPATFFRRSAFDRVGSFSRLTKTAWDMELWADMAMTGATFHRIDAFLAVARLHDGSITSSPNLRKQRLADASLVRQKVRGRPEAAKDRLFSVFHRLRKFSGHPGRTLSQRLFVYSALRRWSL